MAELIGNKVGTFLNFDDSDILGWTKYMSIKVRLKVHKPLPRGSAMNFGVRIYGLRFELNDCRVFFNVYGCLGHGLRECCVDFDEDVPKAELPYELWLRAS